VTPQFGAPLTDDTRSIITIVISLKYRPLVPSGIYVGTTFSIRTLSKMAFRITDLIVSLSIVILRKESLSQSLLWWCLLVIMLSVVILNADMASVVGPYRLSIWNIMTESQILTAWVSR